MDDIKKKVGRPTNYTLNLAEEICETIASSSKGLKKLCKERVHWPEQSNIYIWLKKYPEFQRLYAQAKEFQIEAIVDDILDIADDISRDKCENEDGKITYDHEHINRARLRIDTRKWLAAKLCPRLYGDKSYSHVNIGARPEDLLRELA